jgi:hypothetical protein
VVELGGARRGVAVSGGGSAGVIARSAFPCVDFALDSGWPLEFVFVFAVFFSCLSRCRWSVLGQIGRLLYCRFCFQYRGLRRLRCHFVRVPLELCDCRES